LFNQQQNAPFSSPTEIHQQLYLDIVLFFLYKYTKEKEKAIST